MVTSWTGRRVRCSGPVLAGGSQRPSRGGPAHFDIAQSRDRVRLSDRLPISWLARRSVRAESRWRPYLQRSILARVEPYEAINALERSLRGVIGDVLGDQWREARGVDISKLEARRAEEQASRTGAAVEESQLAYTHIYELREIISKNWEKFKPVFDDKKRFEVYMDRIEDFRNAPMHGRELLSFERSLLDGMVGEFRNVTTIYRSQQGPDRKHYPVVESIVDSFGTEMTNLYGPDLGMNTGIRLQVGDTVEFTCRAWDAQDRRLHWYISPHLPVIEPVSFANGTQATGSSVTLQWQVAEDCVGERTMVNIVMCSDGKYHRMGSCDFIYPVIYAVEPPSN